MSTKVRGHLPVRIGYYFFIAGVIIAALFSLSKMAGALLASLLLSFLLSPVVNFAENRGIPRVVVVLGIYLLVVAVLLVVVIFVGPILSEEVVRLTGELPSYEKQLSNMLQDLRKAIMDRIPGLDLPDLYDYAKERILSGGGLDFSSILARLSGLFSIIMILVIIPIITFFFIVDGHLIQKALLRMVPNRYFEMCVLLMNRTGSAVQNYIRGQLIDSLYVGVMTTIGMAIIGLPYFIAIGIFAGLGNFIPYLGPIIGFIPAFFVVLLTPGLFSGGYILLIAGIFLAVQLTESAFIYPIAVGKSVNLHPLVVILGITIGGSLGGIVGMLVAVPLISIVKVIIEVISKYLKSYRII